MKLTTKHIMFILMSTLLVLTVVMGCVVLSRVGKLLQPADIPDVATTAPSSSTPPAESSAPATSSAATTPPPVTFPNHKHEYVKKNTYSASCQNSGYTLYSCSCGKNDLRDIVNPLGHNFGTATVIAATCDTDGWTERICSRCKLVEKTNSTKAGHKFSAWDKTAVSVGTAINYQRTCSGCHVTEIKSVSPSETWLARKTTQEPLGTFTHYQLVMDPADITYDIYVGLNDKTLEFGYSNGNLSISYVVNGTAMSCTVPSGSKIITLYVDGKAALAKPVEAPSTDTPGTTGSNTPVTTGPVVPETTGPVVPETTGPATPETTGPATPETTGPATPETTGPSGSQN